MEIMKYSFSKPNKVAKIVNKRSFQRLGLHGLHLYVVHERISALRKQQAEQFRSQQVGV